MQIKRFVGVNLNDALSQVKKSLGPDAVIISKRQYHPGDKNSRKFTKPLTEITAALDFEIEEKPKDSIQNFSDENRAASN